MKNENLQHYMEQENEREWRETGSGRLFSRLESIAQRENTPVSITGKDELTEIFHYGTETVSLRKHLKNANVGDVGGSIELCAEGWDYKRKSWWKEAIDAEGISLRFLNTPIAYAARDAQIEKIRDSFVPPIVVERFALAPKGDVSHSEAMKRWVNEEIIHQLSPFVEPDYHLAVSDLYVRLIPNTEEAAQSLMEDNDAYKRVIQKLKEVDILMSLDAAYARKAEEQRRG